MERQKKDRMTDKQKGLTLKFHGQTQENVKGLLDAFKTTQVTKQIKIPTRYTST